jgi:sortase A
MRRRKRKIAGLVLIAAGLLVLGWTAVVWAWRDPVTSVYTMLEQRRLAGRYEALAADPRFSAADPAGVAAAARRLRARASAGDPIGRLRIDRLGLDVIVVEGADDASLRKGPGRDRRGAFPGEGRLVYVAGHRTTYLAPFARIDDLRRGDRVELRMPYGTFVYEVTASRIVTADDLSVLRSTRPETLRLQACHPRFLATRRYVVSARLSAVRWRRADRPTSNEGISARGLPRTGDLARNFETAVSS